MAAVVVGALLLLSLVGCPAEPVACDAESGSGATDTAAPALCPHVTGNDCDSDGFTVPDDCYDHDPAIHPGARDDYVRGDTGVDSDCNGVDGPFENHVGEWFHLQVIPDIDGDRIRDFMATFYDGSVNYGDRSAYLFLAAGLNEPKDRYGNTIPQVTFEDFEYAGEYRLYGGFATGSSLGDVDGDGEQDLGVVCDYPAALCLFRGYPTELDGYYDDEPWTMIDGLPRHDLPIRVLGDLDGDGVDDVAIGSQPAYLYNTTELGEPTFSFDSATRSVELEYQTQESNAPTYEEGRINFGLHQADLDGDGLDELFTGTRFYWGSDLARPGTYAQAESVEPAALDDSVADCTMRPAGDVTGDGAPDLVFNCWEQGEFGRVRVATFESGDGGSATVFAHVEGTVSFPVGPVSGTVGDADGDGLAEVGVGGRQPSDSYMPTHAEGLYVVPGAQLRGAVTLDATLRYVSHQDFSDIALTDFDGDGREDLMVGQNGAASLLPYAEILP